MKELFSCKLCMSAQTGLLFFATPTAWFATGSLAEMLIGETSTLTFVAFGFLVWFSTGMYASAITMLAWNALEYLPERNRIMEEHYEAIRAIAAREASGSTGMPMDLALFCALITELEKECDPIFWCGFERLACRKSIARDFLGEHFKEDEAESILARVAPQLRRYFSERERDLDTNEKLALQTKLYAQI
jgi:hypothetical protein